MKKSLLAVLLSAAAVLMLSSCRSTIENMAFKSIAGMLSAPDSSGVFTSDDDPVLIGDALPLALKLYEMMLEKDPGNADLMAVTGKNFVMYSGAFVQMPADMLEDQYWREADKGRKRAKKLYKRGRDYILGALDLKHEGFLKALNSSDYSSITDVLDAEDTDNLYWAAMGWLGMVSTDPMDMELLTTVDKPLMLLYRAMQLDDSVSAVHTAMIQVNLSVPSSAIATMREKCPALSSFIDDYYNKAGVGKSPAERAEFHFNKAVELSSGQDPSPYINMATALCVKTQNVESFRNYLEKALEINPDDNPESKLMIVVYQDKANWLLEHVEDFFLVDF